MKCPKCGQNIVEGAMLSLIGCSVEPGRDTTVFNCEYCNTETRAMEPILIPIIKFLRHLIKGLTRRINNYNRRKRDD